MTKNIVCSVLSTSFVLFSAIIIYSCKHEMTQAEIQALEKQKFDSLMLAQRTFAQDSISKLGNHLFGDFYLGMSKQEFTKAKSSFQAETNGYVNVENLHFYLYEPEFENGKMSSLPLQASEILDDFQGYFVGNDYISKLKKRYMNRFGYPDLFLNEDYQECDSTSDNLRHMVWLFENRVIHLGYYKYLISSQRLRKSYLINYQTIEDWERTKATFDKIHSDKQKEKQETKEKENKYSNDL